MISSIKLKNFKCFEDETFELKPLTLLTGINGMGKSTLIQSLLLLKQSYVNGYIQNQNKVTLNNNSFIDLENCEQLLFNKASKLEVEIHLKNEKDESFKWMIDASSPDEKEPSFTFNGNSNYNKEALFADSFIYLNSERIGPRKSYSITSTKKTYNTILGIRGELTPAYIQKASTENAEVIIEDFIHPNVKKDTTLLQGSSNLIHTNLNYWLSEILGRKITAVVDTIDKDNLKLSFTVKGNQGGKFSALQVGFGFSFGLPVILSFLIVKPGDLLIIENPEAHLHPAAQAKIGKMLAIAANNGVQVIIETHSDHILNGIRLGVKENLVSHEDVKVYFWGENENNLIQKYEPKIDSEGKISQWPTNFFDTWENSLMDLL